MVKALGNSEEATMLQHRLDDMNQRWNDLKAKSASIRSDHSRFKKKKVCVNVCVCARAYVDLGLSERERISTTLSEFV